MLGSRGGCFLLMLVILGALVVGGLANIAVRTLLPGQGPSTLPRVVAATTATPQDPDVTPSPAVSESPTLAPNASPEPPGWALRGQWLKNHRIADMWSGPADQADATSFGQTSAQFCAFQLRDQRGNRLYVFNPYTENYLWIDKDAVGPVEVPPVRPRSSRPVGQNCSDAIYVDG